MTGYSATIEDRLYVSAEGDILRSRPRNAVARLSAGNITVIVAVAFHAVIVTAPTAARSVAAHSGVTPVRLILTATLPPPTLRRVSRSRLRRGGSVIAALHPPAFVFYLRSGLPLNAGRLQWRLYIGRIELLWSAGTGDNSEADTGQ